MKLLLGTRKRSNVEVTDSQGKRPTYIKQDKVKEGFKDQ